MLMKIQTLALALGMTCLSPLAASLAQAQLQPISPVDSRVTPQTVPPAQTTRAAAPQGQGNGDAWGSTTPVTSPAVPTTSAPPQSLKIQVPVGTHLPLVLHNAISSASARPGDPVYFETLFPIMVDGKVVIPAGSYVSGEVTQAKRPGRVKGRAELAVRLTTMILPNSYMVNLAAAPSNAGTGGHEKVDKEGTIHGDSDKASDAGTVIRATEAGTAVGAGVGAAAGHIGQGVGIGAGAGAAAGLMAVLLTRGPEAEMPRGTTLEAVLDRPIELDADKVQFTSPGVASALAGPPNREPQRQKIPF
jgi:hypothetical protein